MSDERHATETTPSGDTTPDGATTPEGTTTPSGGKKSHRHRDERSGWGPPDRAKSAPQPTRSGKTMHHPAFRIGEIKRGK